MVALGENSKIAGMTDKSTKVDRRNWLRVPSEIFNPPAVTLAK